MAFRSRHLLMFAGSVALFVAACALFIPAPRPLVPGRAGIFPHAVHVGEDVGLECTDCHTTAEESAQAGMPTLDVCWNCHDQGVDQDTPLEEQPAGFILPGDQEPTWTSVTKLSVQTKFSHAKHLEAGASCEDCHSGVSQSEVVSRDWKVGMNECMSCHQGLGVTVQDCQDCHEGLDQDTMPPNHTADWQRIHGAYGSDGASWDGAPEQNCSLCHTQTSCDSCHKRTQPQDHTEPWRERGHGFAAQLDRDRCATCHTEASCDRCHRTALPVTHGGIWGGTTSAHCASCHLPLGSDDSCSVCHKGTPSHQQAPLRPGPPHPGATADCRSCHTPLDHFDNGQDCTLCHR